MFLPASDLTFPEKVWQFVVLSHHSVSFWIFGHFVKGALLNDAFKNLFTKWLSQEISDNRHLGKQILSKQIKKGMTILFKILTTVDLEKKQKKKKKKRRRGPLMQRRLTPLFLSMTFKIHPPPPPKKKKFLVQAFQAGFKYLSVVSLLLYTSQSAIVIKLHL